MQVPFEEVVDLIRQRRVFVRAGFAYVPQTDLVSIVATRVRAHLSKQLSVHARAWPALREDEADRLSGFLQSLATSYVGTDDFADGKSSGVKVSVAELPMLAKRSMPLCMSNMFSKLVETHHLKHKGRNQLGLFLKGIGLTVEESYAVWRGNFTKDPAMTAEKWTKEYAYGIRYNYGLEGKRVNWSPHSCMKIISETGTNAAAGEHHGCPFKTFDEPQLRAQLQQMGVGGADTNFILDKARGQHFQVACGKYFEAKHKGSALIETELGGIMHPNQYFEESAKFHGGGDGAAAPAAASSSSEAVAESAAGTASAPAVAVA
jgi:DNA primase large subunit